MKKLVLATLLFISSITYAQHPEWITVSLEDTFDFEYRHRDFTYFKDLNNSLDKFAGTWVYSQGSEYFKITFIKLTNQVSEMNLRQKEDILITRYEYKQNGNTIFETYSTNRSFVNWSFMVDSNNIDLTYTESSFTHCRKQRIGDVVITYSLNSNNEPIITWNRTDVPINQQPIPCQGSATVDVSNFLTPANMILVKQ
jgi:hypothetical protein